MVFQTWRRVLLCALGVGVLVGAGQLGLGYGLGIVRFARAFDATATNQWPAQLTWVGWFAMMAVVGGAVAADRLARWYGHRPTIRTRMAFAGIAGLGALVVAPLCMLPARAAQFTPVDPVWVTGVCAGSAVLVGVFAAVAVLTYDPVRWNVAILAGGVWLLALGSVLSSLGPTDPLPAVRLGALDPTLLDLGVAQRLVVITLPCLALIAGAATGAFARRRNHPLPVVATCGAAGPALLALSYIIAGPGDTTDTFQAAAFWGALVATVTGALGSMLAAVLRWPETTHQDNSAPNGGPTTKDSAAGSIHPTDSRATGLDHLTGDPATVSDPGTANINRIDIGVPDTGSDSKAGGDEESDDGTRSDGLTATAKTRDTANAKAAAGAGTTAGAKITAKPKVPRQRSARGRAGGDTVSTQDEEYVDWVSGLADPDSQPDRSRESGPRRTLRSSGQHQAE